MSLSIPVVWSDRHRLHEPGARGLGRGAHARDRGARSGPSGSAPRSRRAARGSSPRPSIPTRRCSRCTTRSCSTTSFSAWERWEAAGLPDDPGQDRVVPYIFPRPGLGRLEPAAAANPTARAGQFAYDTMTLIGPGTWEAARAAADAALTAVDLVAGGERAAYACTPAAGPPRRARLLRRLLLPQQRRDRRRGDVRRRRRRAGRGDRHRRPPRQRHPADLLRRPGRAHRLGPRRPGRRLVPALPRLRDRGSARAWARAPTATSRLVPGSGDEAWLDAVGRARRLGRAPAARGRSSSRSASTPPAATRRARSRSASTATPRRAARSASSASRP